MNSTIDFKNNDDLVFFGKVNASISHELKNILAIISEAAGLLHDLTDMATRGNKIELEMLKTCSQDIVEEIERGFTTIKQMNMFSHSVDTPLKSVNIIEALDLIINLAGFLSFASKVRFDPAPEEASIISTCPFRLQNLVYQTLVFAFKSVGANG
jgi:signal transduction histidine kinase